LKYYSIIKKKVKKNKKKWPPVLKPAANQKQKRN